MEKVLITGGTGLIGKTLVPMLQKSGFEVILLSRKENLNSAVPQYKWDIKEGKLDKRAIENVDHIIHLAGAGIGDKKWTESRKQEVIDSRVESTALLLNSVKEHNIELKTFISASGVGYYGGVTSKNIFKETDEPGTDFLAEVCVKWEKEALKFKNLNVRSIVLRTGVVLDSSGGALEKMLKPVQYFVGSALGSGKQYVPWIHMQDICKLYLYALQNKKLNGVYNASSADHRTNKEFTKELCHAARRPFLPIPVPSFMLKMILGEMSKLVLEGSRIDSNKILETGFVFDYPKLEEALSSLV